MRNNLRVAIWKKHLIALLALIMLFAMTACGEDESASSVNSPTTSTQTIVKSAPTDTE